ncbi:MAG: TetR/AcrR family transcriptional regulator [Acidimicrobiales bacterium]
MVDTDPSVAARVAAVTDEVAAHPHGRVPRELRRRQVLAVAEALFVERGYHQASMDELARRVGVSKPVVYDLVGSKEQLFHALMQDAADELGATVRAAVLAEQDPDRRLEAGARAFFGFVAGRRRAWGALMSGDEGPVTTAVGEIRRRQIELIAELLVATEPAGPHAPARFVDAVAHALSGAFEGLAAWWHHQPDVPLEVVAGLATVLVAPGLEALGGLDVDDFGTVVAPAATGAPAPAPGPTPGAGGPSPSHPQEDPTR